MNATASESSKKLDLLYFLFGEDGLTLTACAKLLGIAGAFFYGVGTLVANAYLARIATSDFTWPTPRGVLTGIWATLALLIAALPVLSVWIVNVTSRTQKFLRSVLAFGMMTVVSLYFGTFLLECFFAADLESARVLGFTARQSIQMLLSLTLPVAMCFLIPPFSREAIPERVTVGLVAGSALALTFVVPSLYPTIPSAYGGGHPEKVVFALNVAGAQAVSFLCGVADVDKRPAVSGQAELLYESDKDYVIRATGSNLTQGVSKDGKPINPSAGVVTQILKIPKTGVDAVWFSEHGDVSQYQKIEELSCRLSYGTATRDAPQKVGQP